MSILNIGYPNRGYAPEITIPGLANAITVSSASFSNSICTVTTSAAHGFTFTPSSATTAPNLYFMFDSTITTGSTGISAQSGTGTLVGQVFRILSIPSTTTFTFYTTVTAATFTSCVVSAVFLPTSLLGNSASSIALQPQAYPAGNTSPGIVQMTGGTSILAAYNTTNSPIGLDASFGNTPGTFPTYRAIALASSASGSRTMYFGPGDVICVSGTTSGFVSIP
jgi:hypothetical protein